MMRIDVLTLFPDMIMGGLSHSLIGKAMEEGKVDLHTLDFRAFATNKHNHVDDYPYGGGAGMLLQVEPIDLALESLGKECPTSKKRIILMDPAGRAFTQKVAEDLSREDHLVFICGHYEGYDERIRSLITDEYSLGDFVLTGGELAAMTMIDATVRLLPEVLGNEESAITDSHSTGLLEHPHYTRPRVYKGMEVPQVLLSGHHANIETWRLKESLRKTYLRRPDLLAKRNLTKQESKLLEQIQIEENQTMEGSQASQEDQ